MIYDPNLHHNKIHPLKGYDYSKSEMHFVTMWTPNRECLFGEITDGKMVLNETGKIVYDECFKNFLIHENIKMDVYVVMPNHFHGIIIIQKSESKFLQLVNTDDIVKSIKSAITRKINSLQNTKKVKIWQSTYLKETITDEQTYLKFSEHIINNPTNWFTDNLYKQ